MTFSNFPFFPANYFLKIRMCREQLFLGAVENFDLSMRASARPRLCAMESRFLTLAHFDLNDSLGPNMKHIISAILVAVMAATSATSASAQVSDWDQFWGTTVSQALDPANSGWDEFFERLINLNGALYRQGGGSGRLQIR